MGNGFAVKRHFQRNTDSRASDIDANFVEEAYPTNDTVHSLLCDGSDVDRTLVGKGSAAKMHFQRNTDSRASNVDTKSV